MLSAATTLALAGNIDPAEDGSRYAWGENAGWINLQPVFGPGVTVTDTAVGGLAWGENIGWIDFSPVAFGGVLNDGLGALSGFAWGENVGWINFAPTGGGVSINACGEFDGAAWGENIGWIRLRGEGADPFVITTAWESPVDAVAPVTTVSGIASGWNTSPVIATLSATDCGTGVREVRHTLDGGPQVVSPGSTAALTIATDGIHALSYFAVDNVDNAEPATALSVPIDTTPPAITVASPAHEAIFYRNQPATVSFGVTDATSGLASVTSTLPQGSPIPTSVPGPGAFTVAAADQAGNGASVTHAYSVVTCPVEPAPAGIVSTFAGGGTQHGDGGPATAAHFGSPGGIAVDLAGNVFVGDGGAGDLSGNIVTAPTIRRIDRTTGIITTVAGSPDRFDYTGGDGDGGPATAAALGALFSVAVDHAGSLYLTDNTNNRIRKVDGATGIITTVAGNGGFGFDGDGGPATQAALGFPQGAAVDAAGNIYIADTFNFRVRKVTVATGIIDTFAGRFHTESCSGCEECSTGDGGPAVDATFTGVHRVAVDDAGNVLVVDDCRIRKVDATTGIITTVAGGGSGSGESGPAVNADLGQILDVAPDPSGSFLIGGSYRAWRVDEDGDIARFAGTGNLGFSGDGGPAVEASFADIMGVALGGDGDVYLFDGHDSQGTRGALVRRVTVDADGDGQTDCVDSDDDNDGASDAEETAAGSDPRDPASTPEVCDGLDNDLDGETDEGYAFPGNVGPTLRVDHAPGGGELFTWTDTTAAADYVVVEDGVAYGAFTTVTGTAAGGAAGLLADVPVPPGGIRHFLVAGRNAECGEGPRR